MAKYKDWTLEESKLELRARKVKVTGKKKDLVERYV